MDKEQEATLEYVYYEVGKHLYDDFKDPVKCQLIWEIYEILHPRFKQKKPL